MRKILVLASLGLLITLGGCKDEPKAAGEKCEATSDCDGSKGLQCSDISRTCVDELSAACETMTGCQEAGGCVAFRASVPHDGKGRKGDQETAQLAVCSYKAETDADCEKVCSRYGLCSAVDGVCKAVTDRQCQASSAGSECRRSCTANSRGFMPNLSQCYCTAIDGTCVGFEGSGYTGGRTPFTTSVGNSSIRKFSRQK